MQANLNWLTDPTVFRVNRLDAHSDHVAYATEAEIASRNSSLYQSLDGQWAFFWSKCPAERPADFWQDNFCSDHFDVIQVPGHMETQGYGQIQYINKLYPWDAHAEIRPPQIDWDNAPVGSYIRCFDLEEGLKGERVCISFQGVEQACFVWLNGHFIGYSEDTFTHSEFDLTPYIRETGNRLCVEVHKRCSGSWLEDQDFFRFSGIFRSVFLYAKPQVHVDDVWFKTELDKDNSTGRMKIRLLLSGEVNDVKILCKGMYEGELTLEQDGKYLVSQELVFPNINPWDYREPNLYPIQLNLYLNGVLVEAVPYRIGFRRMEMMDKIMYLNGKRLMINGVNRHEWNADGGRCITVKDMEDAMVIFLENNINAVRTCHYPNRTEWYHMCDENGIYMMDETNLETHGSWLLNKTDRSQYDMWEWINSLNIPENVPEEKMIMSVKYTALQEDVTYHYAVSYGRNGTVETVHYLYPSENEVYDICFDMTLVTEQDISSILETAAIADHESTQSSDWGISISPDRVSRTGATALFVYSGNIPGEDVAELNYGDFLSLDKLVDGNWVPCDELAGYEYFVGDASYPVVNGYGMVHDWDKRFGELADGHYRLGKQVTLVRPDGSRENRMVYGEFSIPDSILTGPIPLEDLPELYGAEQAMIDGCLVSRDGDAMDNIEAFRKFYEACYMGKSGFFRTVDYHYGDEFYYIVQDIRFDGTKYQLDVMDSRDRWIRSAEFRHLKHFSAENTLEIVSYHAIECYVLVDDNNVKLEELQSSRHRQVFADYIYYPKTPQLPENPREAILEFDGQQLISTTDFDRLEKIWILFEEAEFLGYEPKTHSVGIGLHLVLKSQSGETMTIELDPASDICRINEEFVFYGAYDEPDYIEKLWYYLGIDAWPDVVYAKCPNAYRP